MTTTRKTFSSQSPIEASLKLLCFRDETDNVRDLPDIESFLLFHQESNIHVTNTYVASSLIQEGRVICISSQWSNRKGRYTITKAICSINHYPPFINDDTVYTFTLKGQTLKGDVILRPIQSKGEFQSAWQDLHDTTLFSRAYLQAGVIYPPIPWSPRRHSDRTATDIGMPLFYKYTFRSNQPDEWRVLRPLLSRNADLHSMAPFVCPWMCWPGSFFDTEKLTVESIQIDLLQLSEKVITSLREHYSHQHNNDSSSNSSSSSSDGDDRTYDRSSLCIKRVVLDFVAESYPSGHPLFRLLHVAKIEFSSRITFHCVETALTDDEQTSMTTPPPTLPIVVTDMLDIPLVVDDDLSQRLLGSHDIIDMAEQQETLHNISTGNNEQHTATKVTFVDDNPITYPSTMSRKDETANAMEAEEETERKRKSLRDTLLGFTARRLRQRNSGGDDDDDDTTRRTAAVKNLGDTSTTSGMSERVIGSETETDDVMGNAADCENENVKLRSRAEKGESVDALADSWLYLCTAPSSLARGHNEVVDNSNDDNNSSDSHGILLTHDNIVSEEELLEYDRQAVINQTNAPIPRMTAYNASAQMCITELFSHFDRKLDDRLAQRRAQWLAAAVATTTIKVDSNGGKEDENEVTPQNLSTEMTLKTNIDTNYSEANDNIEGNYTSVDRTNCWNFIVPEFNLAADPAVSSAPPLSDIEVAVKDVVRVANVQQARRLEVLQRLEDDRWVLERFLCAIADPDLSRDVRLGIEEHQRRLVETQGEDLLLAYRQRRLELGFDVEEIPEEIEAEFKFRSKYKQFILKRYRPRRTPMSLQNKWKRLLPRGKEQRKEEEEERKLWRVRKMQLQQLVNGNSRLNQFRTHLAQRNAPIDAQLGNDEKQEDKEELTVAVESDELQHRRELKRIRQSLIEDDEYSGAFDDEDDGCDEEEVSEPDEVGLQSFDGTLHDGDEEEEWKRSISAADSDDATMLAREIAALTRLMDAEEAGGRTDIMGEDDDDAKANKLKTEEQHNKKNPFGYPALKENIRRAMALYLQKVAVTPMSVTLEGDLINIPAATSLDVTTAVTRDGLSASRQLSTRVGGDVMPTRGTSVIRHTSRGHPPSQSAPEDSISQTTAAHRASPAVIPERTCHRVDPLVSKNKKPLFYKEAPPVGVLDALAMKIKLHPCIPLLPNSHVVTQTRGALWGNEWTEKIGIVVSNVEEREATADVITAAVSVYALPEDDEYEYGVKSEVEPIEPTTIEPETTITVSDQIDSVLFVSPPLSLSQYVEREQEGRGEEEAGAGLRSTEDRDGLQQPLSLEVDHGTDDGDDDDDVLDEGFDDSDHEGGLSPPSHSHHAPATLPELLDSCSEADINNRHPANSARSTNSTTSLPSFPSSPRHGIPLDDAYIPIRRVSFQSDAAPVEELSHPTSSGYRRNLSSRPCPPVFSKPSKIPYQRHRDVASRDGEWSREGAGKRVRSGACTEDREGNQEPVTDSAAVAPRNIRRTVPRDGITARDAGGCRQPANGHRETGKQLGGETHVKSGEEVRVGVTFQVPDKAPKGLYLIPQSTAAPTGGGAHPRGARLVSSHHPTPDHHPTETMKTPSSIPTVTTTQGLHQGAKKKTPTIHVFKDNMMQALALVRNATEKDRDTEVHLAAASIATRPILVMHKGPVMARKTYIAPPPPPAAPCLSSMHVKDNNSVGADGRLDEAVGGAGGQPPSQAEPQRSDVRDGSCQVRQHADLRLLKGKHMAGAGVALTKAGTGRRNSIKRPEAIDQTGMHDKQPRLPKAPVSDVIDDVSGGDLGLLVEEPSLETKEATEDLDGDRTLTHPLPAPVGDRAVKEGQEAIVFAELHASIAAAAAADVICTVDEMESYPSSSSRNQPLVTSNQEVAAATSNHQPTVDREAASTASIDNIADASAWDAQQTEQHSDADPSLLGLQASEPIAVIEIAWENAAEIASNEGTGEPLMTTSVPENDMDDAKQQCLSSSVPPDDGSSLPHPHAGCSTRPTTTTSSLLAAFSVALSGESWQLPSTMSSSEGTIGITPNSSNSLPHHHLNAIHHQYPTTLPVDTTTHTHRHKSRRPDPLSTKRPPGRASPSVRTWLSSKQNKTDNGLSAASVPVDIKSKPHSYSFH